MGGSFSMAKKSIEGEIFHEIEDMGNRKYVHLGFRDKDDKFGGMLESLVPEIGMTRKARITIEVLGEAKKHDKHKQE